MTRTRRKSTPPPKPKLARTRLDLVREANGAPAADERRGRLVVSIDKLSPDPRNERRELPDIEGMARSLETQGLLVPLSVWPQLDRVGEFYVEAGHRRLAGAKALKWRTIEVIVRDPPKDLKSRDTRRLVDNLQREDLAPLERAEGMARVIEEHRLSQRALADALGKREQWVSDQLAILKLPGRLLDRVRDSKLALSGDALCRAARLKDPAQQEAAIKDLLGGASAGDLRQKIAATKPLRSAEVKMPSSPLFDEFDGHAVDESTIEVLASSPGRYSIEVARRDSGRWARRQFAAFGANVLGRSKDDEWVDNHITRLDAIASAQNAIEEFITKAKAPTPKAGRERSEIRGALAKLDKQLNELAKAESGEPAGTAKGPDLWRGRPTPPARESKPTPGPGGVVEMSFVCTASIYVVVRSFDGEPSKLNCLEALNSAIRQVGAWGKGK